MASIIRKPNTTNLKFLPKKGLEPLLSYEELEPKPSMSAKFHHSGVDEIIFVPATRLELVLLTGIRF